jgi:hypothetical protein
MLALLLTLALGGAAYAVTSTSITAGYTITPGVTTASTSPGGAVGYALNLQATGGFSDNVTLSVASGLPPGATASFGTNPAFVDSSLASASTMWINTTSSVAPGTYTITITGADSTTAPPSQQPTVTLKVVQGGSQDYTIQMTPTTQYVSAGQSVTYSLKVVPANGFTGSVIFSASSVPGAVSLGWDGNTPTTAQNPSSPPIAPGGTATLTVATTGTNPPGSYAINIAGTGGGISHNVAGVLDIDLFSATGSTPTLNPGAPARPVSITLKNPYNYGVTVTGLGVSVPSDSSGNALAYPSGAPIQGCLASWFQATDTKLSSTNTFSLSGGAIIPLPVGDLPMIKMLNAPVNQDACKGHTLELNFVGTAQK